MNVQWSVGKKLTAGFGLALFLLLIISGVAYWSLEMVIDNAWWVAHTHQILENLEGILSLLKDVETGQRGFLLTHQEVYLDPYYDARKKIESRFDDVKDLTKDNKGQQSKLRNLKPLIDDHLKRINESIEKALHNESKGAADPQKAKVVEEVLKQGKERMDNLRKEILILQDVERDLLEKRTRTEAQSIWITKLIIILGSVAAIALLSLIGSRITRGITQPLRELTERSEKIAAGNLKLDKVRIASTDEIGLLATSFNGMLEGLQQVTRQTVAVTENINAAAAEILASTQQQAAGTREQSATVHEITSTMQEISQSGAQISDRARRVAAAAEATATASTAGLQAVQETNRSMEAVREQIEEVAENIVALSEKTQAVGEIIATVNDIAEQSNLLALNATIEAASAGEHGSRFSVVANEMKNLADQAKQATIQIRTILGDIQKGINSSVMLTEEAVKRSDSGKQQAEVTDRTIQGMTQTTQESVQAFQQIIGATSQQQIGLDQVTQGMQDIRQAAEQTASSTAQLEKAAANLNALSQQLRQAVGRYQL